MWTDAPEFWGSCKLLSDRWLENFAWSTLLNPASAGDKLRGSRDLFECESLQSTVATLNHRTTKPPNHSPITNHQSNPISASDLRIAGRFHTMVERV
jgi:hypothetical protein